MGKPLLEALKKDAPRDIKMGHFYRHIESGKVYRAGICTFCNGRKVHNYFWQCLNKERGSIMISGSQLGDCLHYNQFEEITEQEYNLCKVIQMVKEDL